MLNVNIRKKNLKVVVYFVALRDQSKDNILKTNWRSSRGLSTFFLAEEDFLFCELQNTQNYKNLFVFICKFIP